MKALYLVIPLVLSMAVGCGKKEPPKKNENGGNNNAAAAEEINWTALQRTLTVTAVVVNAEVAEPCGLAKPKRVFAYNSASIGGEDHARLTALAECVKSGALAGKTLKVVGHDDPRGAAADDPYRAQHGQTRAEAVGKVLENGGLSPNRMVVVSLGERFATEEGPASWPLERRVDILLAGDNGE